MVIAPDGGFLIGGEMYECPTNQFEALLVRTLPGGYCPSCDTTNVAYTSSAHTPTIRAGFTRFSQCDEHRQPHEPAGRRRRHLNVPVIVLPVELLSFTGEADGPSNVLIWATGTEHNNDRFELERSSDASQWTLLETVPGVGNSQSTLQYGAIDRYPYELTYYRLRQVDLDGSTTFSDVIAVERERLAGALVLYPNPGSDHFTISAQGDRTIDGVEVMAADGRVVLRSTAFSAGGHVDLYVSELASGTYLVRITSLSAVRSTTWVKLDQ
ncbi:MAG: T9SS type A sorting domain-containing protein [Flavobacteriales bacterium]|nr:T9SS type A sorting domain-containing protein [Flavobacteriales bacterium]